MSSSHGMWAACTLEAVDRWKDDILVPDVKLAAKNRQLYMPVVFPGFSWSNLKRNGRENQIPRLRREFLWRQAYNAKMGGAKVLKIAMFEKWMRERRSSK